MLNSVTRSLPMLTASQRQSSRLATKPTSRQSSSAPPGHPRSFPTNLGPYEIIAKPSRASFTLRLPPEFRAIHPVYHVSMLEPAPVSAIPGRTTEPPPPVKIDGDMEYEIAEILDTKLDHRRCCKLLYLVRWAGYEGTDEETSWITADELSHAKELVRDFHNAYPDKPKPSTT
jgi:Chromo (CHRromatin Organisation MOdifier) domain